MGMRSRTWELGQGCGIGYRVTGIGRIWGFQSEAKWHETNCTEWRKVIKHKKHCQALVYKAISEYNEQV